MFSQKFLDADRKVQERWHRLNFHKRFGKKLKRLFLKRLHWKLNKEFAKREKVINEVIATVSRECRQIDGERYPATKQFFNIGLFFLLAERDIQAVKADALAHPSETKRNIALRTLLLTVYEWDMGKVTGRKMHFVYEASGLSDASKGAVVAALKDLKKARKAVEMQISETRHNTIAHREPDALRQHDIISNLDVSQFSSVLENFYKASGALLTVMIPAMQEIGSMQGAVNQVLYGVRSA
ncbi:hypothetical protein G3R49_00705 [Shewanella sp. WXL01]|uniref:hypothetical protein n=1 Tax=Shewanella sp. WXL01 TaxID=2709721 RepID=UPI0014382C79|nr:hypothetical protein [Shewanella sp. WXL01]NKF49094.1 hypothetical protein [Shewanella sp. WXL01]